MIFPASIANYRIKPSSNNEELMTLGRYYSEIGGYMSTILDREHQTFARTCEKRLDRIVATLRDRKAIGSVNDLHQSPAGDFDTAALESLTISDLDKFYRQRPQRSKKRLQDGRESLTFYVESSIVSELRKRKAANIGEQLKIDYCIAAYRNEISNLAFILRKPRAKADSLVDKQRTYTPEELLALIERHKNYRSVEEREALVECVDRALDMIERAADKRPLLALAAELTELSINGIVRCPEWLNTVLADAIKRWQKRRDIADTDIVMPMLALALATKDWSLHSKVTRIVNRCYRAAIAGTATPDELHLAMTCREFITRPSHRKLAAASTATLSLPSI